MKHITVLPTSMSPICVQISFFLRILLQIFVLIFPLEKSTFFVQIIIKYDVTKSNKTRMDTEIASTRNEITIYIIFMAFALDMTLHVIATAMCHAKVVLAEFTVCKLRSFTACCDPRRQSPGRQKSSRFPFHWRLHFVFSVQIAEISGEN